MTKIEVAETRIRQAIQWELRVSGHKKKPVGVQGKWMDIVVPNLKVMGTVWEEVEELVSH